MSRSSRMPSRHFLGHSAATLWRIISLPTTQTGKGLSMISDDTLREDLALQALFLAEQPQKTRALRALAGCGRPEMEAALRGLRKRSLAGQVPGGGWIFRRETGDAGNDETVAAARKRLRDHAEPDTAMWHLGFLEEHVWVSHIDKLLAFLDERLGGEDEAVNLCLELTVRFFLELGGSLLREPDPVQGRKFLETVILVQVLCFSNKLHLEGATRLSLFYYEINLAFRSDGFPMYMDMVKKFTDFSLSSGSIASELTRSLTAQGADDGHANHAALLRENPFVSVFQQLFDVMESDGGAAEKQILNVIATGLSHIAMHMRNFGVSEHISRSLLKLYDPKQQNGDAISFIWLSHYCFVLLRQGKLDEALEHIDFLFNCLDTKIDALSFASAARAVALYHFFCGRIKEAHTVLTRESLFAMEHGVPHAPFLDPMNFDMLFVFEQRGFAPVPRYELDPTIEEVLAQGGQLMQGTALRIKALRQRARGANPRQVIRLLEASREKFDPERDVRELTLTLHELANTLCLAGEYEEAAHYRKIIAAHAGAAIEPDIPYSQLAFIATCIPSDREAGIPDSAPSKDSGTIPLLRTVGDGAEEANREAVIGEGMQAVLRAAESAAASAAFILIQGETGVGKELVARHIHTHSGRSGAFVAIHPASTSETLFESEFFGHERGAFTGATTARKGFFEEADGGTLFIDEVGDIPPLLQTKLLRVLQERSFMRVGSNRPLTSDFRLITATNKNILDEVEKGLFRADLMFRMAVIPLAVPPLRERPGDILPLARFYVRRFCRRYGKSDYVLGADQENMLMRYHWPGNVRELKNLMERVAVEGCFKPEFLLYAKGPAPSSLGHDELFAGLPGLEELERRYLRHVLGRTGGKIRGAGGAAALLGIKVSTLYAKLRRLNIAF